MAVNTFLKLEPTVKGESIHKGYEGQIDLLSFNLGVSNTASISAMTGGAGQGKANFHDFSIIKGVDTASPIFHQMCAQGKHFDKATVTFLRQSGDAEPHKFLVYEFEEVYITSVHWSGSGDAPTESASFAYASIKTTYDAQDSKGKSAGKPVGTGWHVRKNSPLGK
jgi:type VI secretion system secreted protein Hcp